MEGPPSRVVSCRRFRHGRMSAVTDTVAREVALTVRLDDGPARRLFASPLDVAQLALGHAALEMTPAGRVPVLSRSEALHFELVSRPDPRPAADPGLPRVLPAADWVGRMRRFIAAPGLWDDTGCFHRAALYDTVAGEFLARSEDIGRHNCLDRLAGQALGLGVRLEGLVLFVSCRVTASLMEKALRAGSRFVVSRSAVTDAAMALAGEAGATLVGFAREAEERLTVFVDPKGRVGS